MVITGSIHGKDEHQGENSKILEVFASASSVALPDPKLQDAGSCHGRIVNSKGLSWQQL